MTERSPLAPLPPEAWSNELSHLTDSFASRLNVYRVMAHHPALLNSWVDLRKHVVKENALGPELLEIAILRTAAKLSSRYEWVHHVARATALGMDADRIHLVGGSVDAMSKEDGLIAGCVDSLIDQTRLDAVDLRELTDLVGIQGVFDLMATVGFYKTLGCIAATFGVQTDDLETEGTLGSNPN